MPLANNDRPDTKPVTKPTAQVDLWENGNVKTPVEGCSPRKLSTPPAPRDQASTKSSVDDAESEDIFSPESWDPPPPNYESPGSESYTPGPVVVGVKVASRPSPAPEVDPTKQEPIEDWRDPGARNTPAEPVASRRVRQRASEKVAKRRSHSQHPRRSANICDDRVVTEKDLRPSAQYFPPMKPPESLPGHVATKPKVQIVPDCDTRLRTARSLRRQSSRPPSNHNGWRLTLGWPLYLLVAAAACLSAIGLVRGLTLILPRHSPSIAVEPTPIALPPPSPSALSTAQFPPDAHLVEPAVPAVDRNPIVPPQPRKGEQQPGPDASLHKLGAPAPGVTATESVTDATVF